MTKGWTDKINIRNLKQINNAKSCIQARISAFMFEFRFNNRERQNEKGHFTRKDRAHNERSLQVILIIQLPVSYTVKDNIPGANIMD